MLYLVRHGETSMNKRNLMCGRTDVELTENGKPRLSLPAKGLKTYVFQRLSARRWNRAKNTLALILSQNERPRPDITEDPRIIERDFGYFEAQTNETHPEFHLRWRLDYDSGRVFMESIAHMKERIGSFLIRRPTRLRLRKRACRNSCRRDTHIPNAFRRRKKPRTIFYITASATPKYSSIQL